MGAHIYMTGKFKVAYLCTKCSEVGDILRQLVDDVEIPDLLSSYLMPEITGKKKEFQDQVKHLRIDQTHSEA